MSEQTHAIYRKIEHFLTENNLSPNPTNYAVAFAHLQKHSSKLSQAINEHLHKHGKLNETFTQQIFSEFIQQPDYNNETIYPALQSLLTEVYSVVEKSHLDSASYIKTLNAASVKLDETQPESNIQMLVGLLKKSTDSMRTSQEKLSQRLQQAEQESEQLQQQLHQVAKAAMFDDLTGLLNRAGLRKKLEEQSEVSGVPFEESLYSVIVFDLDKFKSINDTYGHPFGDRVLSNTGSVITKHIRGNDLGVRFGGEEFIVILPDTDLQGAHQVAEKIRRAISNVRWINRRTNEKLSAITISAGISQSYQSANLTLDDVIQVADDALYRAKNNGRNCCYMLHHQQYPSRVNE